MALDEYKKKRDFTSSPEPAGDEQQTRSVRKGKPLFFCVQKHLASHLHYDFRLEHDGVLLSWAVPKGPSLDPATKRLAMHVEDHPFEYGTFEGVIPEGYGAGIVMLWDTGTWVPEVDDVSKALAKGDLKLELDGYKLKGSWALVRTKGWGGRGDDGRSWLLIKHRDEWAGDVDIATFAPLSVKSKQDFADILAADNPDIWRTNRPVEGGETGALLKRIIEQAALIKAGRAPNAATSEGVAPAAKSSSKAKPASSTASSRRKMPPAAGNAAAKTKTKTTRAKPKTSPVSADRPTRKRTAR
ncbi:MAG: DNA polymerase ligase N-terminal domain-containing protein [Vicinamibacterales bacterium]